MLNRILYSSSVARIVPFTEARSRLSDLLDAVEADQEHVVITRNGRPIAVLLSVDEWESVEETLDALADPELLGDHAASERDVAAGRLFSLDEVRRELGLA
jgi:antitoxin YefM